MLQRRSIVSVLQLLSHLMKAPLWNFGAMDETTPLDIASFVLETFPALEPVPIRASESDASTDGRAAHVSRVRRFCVDHPWGTARPA